MLETFQSRNSRDFRQRYQNSWGFFKTESGERLLVVMRDIGDHTASFEDARGARYKARADTDVEFEFIPVNKRLFIHDDNLMYVGRVPARMFSRGVNEQNTQIVALPQMREEALTFQNILSAFASEHAPVEQSHTRQAFTLSDTFGVTSGILYVYQHQIGTWDSVQKQVKVTDKMFVQEIKDLLAQYSLPYQMVD